MKGPEGPPQSCAVDPPTPGVTTSSPVTGWSQPRAAQPHPPSETPPQALRWARCSHCATAQSTTTPTGHSTSGAVTALPEQAPTCSTAPPGAGNSTPIIGLPQTCAAAHPYYRQASDGPAGAGPNLRGCPHPWSLDPPPVCRPLRPPSRRCREGPCKYALPAKNRHLTAKVHDSITKVSGDYIAVGSDAL
ncbi:UNVERIFIED_CONTAM: hypothetical protein K2H54_022156 [Gekko kuhli]